MSLRALFLTAAQRLKGRSWSAEVQPLVTELMAIFNDPSPIQLSEPIRLVNQTTGNAIRIVEAAGGVQTIAIQSGVSLAAVNSVPGMPQQALSGPVSGQGAASSSPAAGKNIPASRLPTPPPTGGGFGAGGSGYTIGPNGITQL